MFAAGSIVRPVAKKTRTPPPPRRPGAPPAKGSASARPSVDDRRRRQITLGLAAVGLVAVVAIALAVVLSRRSTSAGASAASAAKALAAAGCTFQSVKPLPPTHPNVASGYHADVPTLTSKAKWATDPPSAGAHYQLWAVWNFYAAPVLPVQAVHNEEHGGIVIWWGSKVAKSEVDKLAAFYQSSPDGMLGTPYPKLGDKIALTAWNGDPARYYQKGYYGVGKIAVCPRFNENAFTAFRDAFRGHGPEGIPLSADTPGHGPNG